MPIYTSPKKSLPIYETIYGPEKCDQMNKERSSLTLIATSVDYSILSLQ